MNATVVADPREAAVRWGTGIEDGRATGHPCRQYAERPHSLAELLLDAQRWSEREFLVQGKRRLTGAEHARAVACVAAELKRRGVKRGDFVLLQGFNRIEWVVSFWALQTLGAIVAFGNAWWSAPETAAAITLTKPVLAVGERMRPEALPADLPTVSFAEVLAWIDAAGDLPLRVELVAEEQPALVIFSSGTTGNAKGVVMSHRSVIANIQNLMHMTSRLPSQLDASHPGTVNLMTMPLFHQGGLQISLMTLLSGGKIVFLEGRFDPLQVLELIDREKVRAWGTVPTMAARVVQHERFVEFDTRSVSSVQMGGAPIPAELRAEIARAFPNSRQRVGSMYGLTETGVVAAGTGSDIEGRPGCVGRPLPVAEIRIANPDPNGVGEIVVRTPSATIGYLGDDKPVADAEGWIASGDLGRFDDEGRLYIVGRSKDMIIRGGENVASVHVESCLRMHPKVAEVAVVPLPHPDFGEEVGAAIVVKPGEHVTAEELQAFAVARLACFEVPSRWWLMLDPLPTNATGKVLKREVLAQWPETY
ncbi:MAG: acyl--CoA ligase [Burkholderiaceae bacterium]|nr:acyl--CoA ligase [Burkholderiaceae bacterium]